MRKKLFALLVGILAVTLLLTACAGVNLTLTFEVDGEAYATVTTTGQEAVQMPKDPTKEGYLFDGWYWDKDVWEKPFTANSLLETPLSDNMTVYARFVEKSEVEQFTVIFNANGGAFDAQTTSLSQTVAKNSTLTAPTSPARSGYSFSGWATDSAGSVMWQFGSDRVLGNLTLYAIWNQQAAAVLSMDGAQIKGMEIHMFVSPETESVSLSNKVICSTDSIWRLYYDRLGQTEIPTKIAASKQGELLDGDNVFYLVVTSMSGSQVNTYTLTIHRSYLATVSYYDGESLLDTVSFYTGNSFKASFIPKITGYVFNEWAKKDGTSFDEDVLWKSTELYTVKTPNSYTVHYNAGEGEMSESTAKVNYGENYRLAVPTRIGYTFVGWKYGSQRLTDGKGNSLASFMQTSDITVTSEWTANDYNLTLKQNIKGGTISGEGKFKYDSRVYVTAKVEKGYNFVGWYDNKDILLSKNAAYNFIMGLDLVLTAKFELAKLTLNYVVNGKVADTETFTWDKPLTEFLKYSTQSNFVGWFSSAKFNVTDTKITTTEELTLTNNNAYLYGGTYTGAEGQEFTYTNNGYTLSAFRGTATGAEISSTFNGVGVNSVGSSAFSGCSSLVSVEIPSSVTSIGSSAFRNCSSLESITVPYVGATKDGTSKTHFGYIFGANSYGDHSNYVPKTLKTVIITGGTSIGSSAFRDCSSLVSIGIPSSVTSIGSSAFRGCSSLVSIGIPSSVTSIGSYAFSGCSSLTKVEISDIAAWCRIKFGDNDANPLTYAKHLYINGEEVTELVIPEGVTSIGSDAFRNCRSLVSIEIPTSVTSIGSSAFSSCDSLTIYAEASAKPSGWDSSWNSNCPVVWDCKNNDVASDGFIYTVQNGIRYGIKDGVATVVRQPSNIKTANIPSEIVYKDNTYSVTSIGYRAFSSCISLVSVVIGNGVTSIGDNAFQYCRSLVSVEIPTSVTSIDFNAFYNCLSLVSIVIPTSVTSIGNYAFAACLSLTIYVEASAKPSGWDSSWNPSICPVVWNYKNNAVASDGFIYTVQNGIRYGIKGGVATVVEQPRNITTANIPSEIVYKDNTYSVTSIGSSAFWGCSSLVSVEIPSSVTSIGNEAFRDCDSLVSISIPFVGKNAKASGYEAVFGYIFGYTKSRDTSQISGATYQWDDGSNYYHYYIPASIKTVVITGSTSIGNYAFYNCSSLVSVEIPSGVTSIGTYAFYNCSSLTKVEISDIAAWCRIKFGDNYANPLYYAKHLYINGEEVTELVIPEGVTSIGYNAFSGSSLVSVEIPSGVTSIGTSAFSGCGNLESIVYGGTKAEWKAIAKGRNWNYYSGNYTVTCTDGTLSKAESML